MYRRRYFFQTDTMMLGIVAPVASFGENRAQASLLRLGGVDQTEKLSPQPQVPVMFGLLKTNSDASFESLK